MLVGVISDIHGHLSEQAYDALQPCDMILCAGDVERPTILMELDAIAPTVAVLGNCDSSLRGMDIPFTASPRIGGVRFFMTHRPEDIGTVAEDVRVVVHKSCALAAQTFMIAMANEGYDTCPLEGLDSRRLKRLLKLPHGAEINMVVSCGIRNGNKGIWGERCRVPFEEVYRKI